MLIGHNPEMTYSLEMLCDAYEHMPTAAVAEISLPVENWAEMNELVEGQLLNLWKPRALFA